MVFFFFGFKEISFARRDLSRAALFLWMMCIFAVLSIRLIALFMSTSFFPFVAFLIASLSDSFFRRFSNVRFLSFRNFLIADLMIGIGSNSSTLSFFAQWLATSNVACYTKEVYEASIKRQPSFFRCTTR